ncbi:GNAT family N-acetyltransferase [Comamonas sp. JC664]|uniref:GNAT family N-acetyltransferase n=1 Tax=Comamonas sp. JC664 TaxID=2801917 RepID=UPI00174C7AC6|nr:GNAT family N-acetyltransferase [Comamonas sp. JC664]MBL0696036.1 GNAT family N-acetyltransferase [Comamonas sp. JC664]GHG64877.1 GCN5 family acetyltransferase [Comamonas sp. KCTC 72670]
METTPAGDFGPPRDERELAAVADIMMHSYAMSPADSAAWLQRTTRSDLRVLRQGGHVAGSLVHIPMGQWYGGRSVPVIGVGGVGVSPVHRGQGTATRLMQHLLREARASGAPLSVLYPATQPLYRRVGYEHAGARYELRVQVPSLDFTERTLSLRAIEAADTPAILQGYQRYARHRTGWLDRTDFSWGRVRNLRGEVAHGYLVEGKGGVEGYLYVIRRQVKDFKQELFLTDVVAHTPAAARRILSFLGDHRSLAMEASWYGGVDDPLLLLLREQTYSVKLYMYWMVRVLDVASALQARGWPEGLTGTLHLEVEDDLFPENAGRYVLDVADGQAKVHRGGDGRLRLHVKSLAPLYAGHLNAESLRAMGALEADDASVRVAGALFAGPPPSLRDMF